MSESSVSKARSYQEMGEYWGEHDLGEIWDETEAVEFEVDLQSDRRYYPLERSLAERVAKIAEREGVSAETLLNLWVREKVEVSGG